MVNIVDAESARENLAKVRTEAEERRELQRLANDILEEKKQARGDAEDEDEEASSEDDDDDSDGDSLEEEFEAGPTVWEAAAEEEVPENHWEYHMRKNMNDGRGDSVARNLSYVPVCNCMPVCTGERCRNPYFMWTKKR
jgi:hypothetical protein